MNQQYVPDAGDIIWINFTPQAGHEQAGQSKVIHLKSILQEIQLMLLWLIKLKVWIG